MKEDSFIPNLRHVSRQLIRELGMLQLNNARQGKSHQHWHALIEIDKEPGITIANLSNLLLLSNSAASRIVDGLVKMGYVTVRSGIDKREKHLEITEKGKQEITVIDDFSHVRIKGALSFLEEKERMYILSALERYTYALKQSRLEREQLKILTLSTSRTVRKQIISMIESIQRNEFSLPITDKSNICVLKAEEEYYYNNSYNFWYVIAGDGTIIGSIGLRKIDDITGQIKKFFVHPNYRGKGVAQKLITKLVSIAIKHNFKELYLGTVDKLKGAQRFYEKKGFKAITKDQTPDNFELNPLDTVFMKGNIEDIKTTLYEG
jgi:DNA-binding MarR family transcriptional regulator/N-acetylglutamate synthase-like GNAT family acetyltransferase